MTPDPQVLLDGAQAFLELRHQSGDEDRRGTYWIWALALCRLAALAMGAGVAQGRFIQ